MNFVKTAENIQNVQRTFAFPSLQDQRELVAAGLAVEKEFDDKVLFKYHRNVMYDYAWEKSKHLMECRGHVYSKDGQLLNAPPRKSFNYLENGWWEGVSMDDVVYYAKKYNGFLAVSTEGLGISTTGSLDSEYVELAQDRVNTAQLHPDNASLHFEIIDSKDPHIVEEGKDRSELLAYREVKTGNVTPNGLTFGTLREALAMAQFDKGEGFMVYHSSDEMHLSPCKIKTAYYVGKKKLMRASKSAVDKMYKNPVQFAESLPVNWSKYPSVICSSFEIDRWKEMQDQERRSFIELIEKDYYFV